MRRFKFLRDPSFAGKRANMVGLKAILRPMPWYFRSMKKARSKYSDIQPGLPIYLGHCQTMTHDYKCHGTNTLVAALSVLNGMKIGRWMRHNRHICFLNAVEYEVPAGQGDPIPCSTAYATGRHPKPLVWTQSAAAILIRKIIEIGLTRGLAS
jgi:hypothetical protein